VAYNGGTATTSKTTTVNVTPKPVLQKPTIQSFTATPASIIAGQSSTLAWSTTGAVALSIDQGVGAVTGTSKSVAPTATTTYTLSASNAAGTTTATVTVNVAPVVVVPPPPSNNLVQNGTFEAGTSGNPTNWTHDYWGTMNPTFTYPVTGKGGGKAAQITVTNFTSGAANWIFPHISTTAHSRYQYSEDYFATVPTEIDIEYLMSDGSYTYDWFMTVPATGTWQTVTGQITPPPGAVSFTVLHALAAKGTLTIDNVSVSALNDTLPQGMVSLTFDDGLLSQYQNALPILKDAGVAAGFYVITTEPTSGDSGYMSWAQIKDLKSKGYEVGAHTRTHPFLTQQTSSQLNSEVAGSYSDLVAQGITPKSFVYPFGDVNPTVENAVKSAGFSVARGSYAGVNGTATDRYNLYDVRLDKTTTLAKAEAFVDQALADKRWVVFEIHDVLASGGDEYAITPSFLQSLVTYIKQKGISTVTLEQGAQNLSN
jgi:peptidoglycan/xylan/chitin deacetylase (PgdA/CDA1 family)